MRHHDTIYSCFRQMSRRRQRALAVSDERRSVTYAQLDMLVDEIYSRFAGKRYRFIGIVMEHSVEMIATMLAVLKSGAAYVPAEPSLPAERRRYMMEQTGCELIITDDYCRNLSPATSKLPDRSRPDDLAYVLYTSGTTGRPKGVMIANSSVVNYAEAFRAEFHTGPGDVMLQYSVCSFDIFVEEVFTTLLNGAALAIAPKTIREAGAAGVGKLMEYVADNGVTEISGFPYLLAEMDRLPSIPSCVRLLISGGDVLRASYIKHLRGSGAMIYNTYGPSETTVCATYQRCDNIDPLPDGTYPIGHAIKGVEIRVLDDNLSAVRRGVTGEICITGSGVGRGYIGNPPEQANFVRLGDGSMMYRTGDLGYVTPDGTLAFLHRKDDQVMILGKRVEPGEVENVLSEDPQVERCVVRPFNDDEGLAYLVAYVVPKPGAFSLRELKEWLRGKLTDFMVPEFFVTMKSIPVNKRGKVDVDALPVVLKEGGEV